MKKIFLFLPLMLAACGPQVPVLNLKEVSADTLRQANGVSVYQLESSASRPKVLETLGMVEAYSCKGLMTDPPASKGNALQQLRVKAAELGANAVIDVTFDERGTDAWGTNCWETVQASGMAVRTR